MAVTHTTIFQDSWKTINDSLKTLFGLSIIRTKFPDNPSKIKDSDLPLIVQPLVEVEGKKGFFGRTRIPKEINIMVEIYSRNPSDIDSYSSIINTYFENNTVADLHLVAINGSDVGELNINNKNYYFRIINLSFRFL